MKLLKRNELAQFIFGISLFLVLGTGFVWAQEAVLDITWRGFAQNFKLDNFQPNPDGWIQVPAKQTGRIIMDKFQYPSGTYRIKIQVDVDKKGLASTINLYVNDDKIASVKEDQDTGGSAMYEVKDIKINQGDKLAIEGINDGEEFVRIGRLQIINQETELQAVALSTKQEEKAIVIASGNILKNPGFEIDGDKNNIPDGWKCSVDVRPDLVTSRWDDTNVHSGAHSVNISVKKPPETFAGKNAQADWRLIGTYLPVDVRKKYSASVYIYADNVNGNSHALELQWFNKKGGNPIRVDKVSAKEPNKWVEVKLTDIIPPEGAVTVAVLLRVYKAGNYFFDDISFTEEANNIKASNTEGDKTAGGNMNNLSNIANNPNFEEDTDRDGVPDNWLPPSEGCGSWATDKVISGKYSIKIENSDASVNPCWQQKNIPIKANQKYLCTINVMAKDFGQEYRFYVEAGPQEGGWWTSSAKWEQAFASWQKKSLEFTATKPTVTKGYLVLQIKGKGTIWFDDVEIKAVIEEKKETKLGPLEIELLQPSYRSTIYAAQDLKTIKLKLKTNLAELKDKKIEIFVNEDKKELSRKRIFPITDKESIVELDISNFKTGKYTIFGELLDSENKTLGLVSCPLSKVKRTTRAVRVREDNVLLVNERPFFPLGVTFSGDRIKNIIALRELQQAGFNLIACWGPIANEKDLRDSRMELANKYDLMVMPVSLAGGYIYKQMRSGKTSDIEAIKKLVEEDINNMETYNNFLGWWIDEPIWNGLPKELLAEIYRQFSALDPYHIYWVNHAPRNSLEELAEANRFADITGSDIYPVSESQQSDSWSHSDLPNKTISVVGDETDKLTKTVEGKKPVWMLLQGFSWGDLKLQENPNNPKPGEPGYRRQPNGPETRFMAYDAIVHGAKGIVYYGVYEHLVSPQVWPDIKNVVWEIRNLSPVLVAPAAKEKIAIYPKDATIEFIAKQCEGKLYLIAINTQTKPADVQFSNPGIEDETMRVLFEKESLSGKERQVKLVKGTFSDKFQGYDVHIYTTARNLPEPLVPLKALSEEEQKEVDILKEKFGSWKPAANWIWYPGLEKTEGTVYARKEFNLSRIPEESWLIMTVDNNYKLYVNENLIGEDWENQQGGWATAEVYDITKFLKKGKNVIAVLANNAGSYAGIYAEVPIHDVKDSASILSDTSWLVSSKEEPDWEKIDFKPTDWIKALELGKPPVKPWGMFYLQLGKKPALVLK